MTREIKFRAWHKEFKIMVEVLGFHWERGMEQVYFLHPKNKQYYHHILSVFEVMQFTGLRDKNNKEVFEGDVLQCYYAGDKHGAIEQVEFKDGAFILRHRAVPISTYLEFDGTYTADIEIIGNIYESELKTETK